MSCLKYDAAPRPQNPGLDCITFRSELEQRARWRRMHRSMVNFINWALIAISLGFLIWETLR